MGQKVLGLDIGTYSIKGAIYDISFRSYILTDLYESGPMRIDELQAEDKIVVTAESLKKLADENRITADAVITSISGALISTRMLTLPFDKKKVEKVLPFELESFLPFPIEDLIIDFHTVSSSRKETKLIACAVKKEIIANHLKILKTSFIDPKLIDVDSFSLLNIYHSLKVPENETFGIIDLGHTKTTISIISKGNLEFTRTFLTGGRNLTNALRIDLDLTYEQAERVKIKHGILDAGDTPAIKQETKKVSESLKNAIDPLIEEINQTVHSYKAQHSAEADQTKTVKGLFLCGGTSLLKNIDQYFTHKAQIQTGLLHSFPTDHEISKKLGSRERIMTGSIGLGLKSVLKSQGKKTSDINLRKREFTYQHEFKNLKGRVSFVGTWLLVLIAFVLINFGIRYYRLANKSSQIEKKVLEIFSQTVDDYPKGKITSSNKALTIMRSRIGKFKERINVLTAGLEELSALSVLREISARMPKEITVDVRELNIFKNNIVFRGETDSFASVDKIIANLSKFEPFTKVEKGEISDASDPSKKKFSINITVGEKRE